MLKKSKSQNRFCHPLIITVEWYFVGPTFAFHQAAQMVLCPVGYTIKIYLSLRKSCDEFSNNLEFTPEESILAGVQFVLVHPQEFKIDPGDSFYETLKTGPQLEFTEEASSHAACGGPGETDL